MKVFSLHWLLTLHCSWFMMTACHGQGPGTWMNVISKSYRFGIRRCSRCRLYVLSLSWPIYLSVESFSLFRMRCRMDQQSISDPCAESSTFDKGSMPQPPTPRDAAKQRFQTGRRLEERLFSEGGSFLLRKGLDSFNTDEDKYSTSSLLTNQEPGQNDDVSLQAAKNVSGALFEMWISDYALFKWKALPEFLREILMLNIDPGLAGITLIVSPVVSRHLDRPQFTRTCFRISPCIHLVIPTKTSTSVENNTYRMKASRKC